MYQAVGINISGGSVNVNSTQLTAKTVPSNISVKWKSSNSKVSVNGSGLITAKAGSGDAVITATMTYMGKEYSDSVTINLGESQHNVIYCMNMDNSGYRYYTDVHYKLAGTGNSKWGVNFNKSRNHHCFSNNCCGGHANKTVGYSTLYNSKTVNPGDFFRNSIYAGYNKTQKTGYVFNNGSGDAIYFEIKQTTSGPRGFYIKKIYY